VARRGTDARRTVPEVADLLFILLILGLWATTLWLARALARLGGGG